jgi:hypothetical protein
LFLPLLLPTFANASKTRSPFFAAFWPCRKPPAVGSGSSILLRAVLPDSCLARTCLLRFGAVAGGRRCGGVTCMAIALSAFSLCAACSFSCADSSLFW